MCVHWHSRVGWHSEKSPYWTWNAIWNAIERRCSWVPADTAGAEIPVFAGFEAQKKTLAGVFS